MSTLEVLRNRAGIFVAIIIGLGLFAFIFSDLFTSGQSMFAGDQMEVGSVDGKSLSYPQFQATLDEQKALRMAFTGQRDDSERFNEQLREQVWQMFVRNEVMGNECKRIGLSVTGDELSTMVIGQEVHPIVEQIFTNPETGVFDREMVIGFLSNLEQGATPEQRAYWLEVEREIHDERVMQKFNALIAKGLYVTQYEADLAAQQRANEVDLSYVFKPFASIPDSTVKVTSQEAKQYYNRHRELFRGTERRDLAYVSFPVTPRSEDVEAARVQLESLIGEFAQVENAGQYAAQNGDRDYTGSWFMREELQSEIAEWAFGGAAVGSLSPVVQDDNEFMVARLLGRTTMPDSANARHILFSLQRYPAARANELADSVADAIRNGGDFAALAEEFSDDPGSRTKGGDLDWFPQGVMVKPFNDACFNGKVGDIQVVSSNFGVHVIELLGHRGGSERVDVAILSQRAVAGNHTFQLVYNDASSFATEVHRDRPSWFARLFGADKGWAEDSENVFDSVAQLRGLSKRLATGVEEGWSQISGLESSREMVRWAFEAAPGQVSAVFELPDEYVVALLLREKGVDGDYSTFASARDEAAVGTMRLKKEEMLRQQIAAVQAEGQGVEQVASALGEEVRHASNVEFNGYAFGQEGFEPGLVGAGASLAQGQMSAPVAGINGVYVMQGKTVSPVSGGNSDIRSAEMEDLRRRSSMQAYDALRGLSKVKDRRAKFF